MATNPASARPDADRNSGCTRSPTAPASSDAVENHGQLAPPTVARTLLNGTPDTCESSTSVIPLERRACSTRRTSRRAPDTATCHEYGPKAGIGVFGSRDTQCGARGSPPFGAGHARREPVTSCSVAVAPQHTADLPYRKAGQQIAAGDREGTLTAAKRCPAAT